MLKPHPTGIFKSILRHLKRLSYAFREKVTAAIDESDLEHFLLYHKLVGTQALSPKEFHDVRADVRQAIEQGNSHALCIALKLPPLWWQEKLQSIVAEPDCSSSVVSLLMPERCPDGADANSDPLRHPSWSVRANAAHLLSYLGVRESVPRLIEALLDNDQSVKPAFCHIACALGQLGGEEARLALTKMLYHHDSWFRVDAAYALSLWQDEIVVGDLLKAMLSSHLFSDYMAVVIARRHQIDKLLFSANPLVQQGCLEIILGVVKASLETFPKEIVMETGIYLTWTELMRLSHDDPTPRSISATLALGSWLCQNCCDFIKQLSQAQMWPDFETGSRDSLTTDEIVFEISRATQELVKGTAPDLILEKLAHIQKIEADDPGEARHILRLVGELKLTQAVDQLIALLEPDSNLIDEVVESLGKLGSPKASAPLANLAKTLIDVETRQAYPASAQPIFEDSPVEAKTYWLILKALGNLPDHNSIALLLEATHDFAPDKREQALSSLISATAPSGTQCQPEVKEALSRALKDRSSPVKLTALSGASKFGLIELLPSVLKLCSAKESSLRDKSFQTLSDLAKKGHREAVIKSVRAQKQRELNQYKRKRWHDLLDSLINQTLEA